MNRTSIRGLVFSALFAAIMMALSWLKFDLASGIPITFSTLAIMLAGSLLGPRYGFSAILLVIGLVAAGFPALAGRGGMALLAGPTAGYIWAWPFAALLIGVFAKRVQQDRFAFWKLILINFVFGSLLLYPTGVWWLAHKMNIASLDKALWAGMWPFLPGDLIKAVICAGVTVAVSRVYPMDRIVGTQVSGNSK